jgi:hypothetical protein
MVSVKTVINGDKSSTGKKGGVRSPIRWRVKKKKSQANYALLHLIIIIRKHPSSFFQLGKKGAKTSRGWKRTKNDYKVERERKKRVRTCIRLRGIYDVILQYLLLEKCIPSVSLLERAITDGNSGFLSRD